MLFGGFLRQLILWLTILQLGANAAKKATFSSPPSPSPSSYEFIWQGKKKGKPTGAPKRGSSKTAGPGTFASTMKSCSAKRDLGKRACIIQKMAPWHLEWISVEDVKSFPWKDVALFHYEVQEGSFTWRHDTNWGSNVIIYVLDTGVNGAHDAFTKGQVEAGAHVSRLNDDPENDAHIDKPGHGTGCASLIVGQMNGIARKGIIYPIKIDNIGEETDDTNKDVTEAITIAVKNWKSRVAENPKLRAVINISWIVRHSAEAQAAIELAIEASMHVVISAGNAAANECYDDKNPTKVNARVKSVGQIVVSGSNLIRKGNEVEDEYSSQANYGPCIDIVTPNFELWMANAHNDDTYRRKGATSSSVSIVAGVIAAILSSNAEYRDLRPIPFREKFLAEFGVKGVNTLPPDTPDRRLLIKKLVDSL